MSPRNRTLALVAVALVVTGGAGITAVFGQNIRALFSTSSQVLHGTQRAAVRSGSTSHNRRIQDSEGSIPDYGAARSTQRPSRETLEARRWEQLEGTARGEATAEEYLDHGVNPFVETARDPLSTFSVDVDTASYSIVRRKLQEGARPAPAAVRVEELLNYFRYDYPAPAAGPFAVHLDAAPSPYAAERHLLRIGLQGRRVEPAERKPAHLTFLVDVSGSMEPADRLPLAKRALRILVDNLRSGDTVALVTYASGVREVLPPTGLAERSRIHAAIEDLAAGGSTAMADGLEVAYRMAARALDGHSVSRVIVLSDGDANVGARGPDEMLRSIREHVEEGVTLSTVGFGMGNYRDGLMERLADAGNGNYAYVDGLLEARRIFEAQLGGTLEVIAQDVKLQVEFDPRAVRRYRLLGYENRDLADQRFRDDRADAGEIGAGHSVTALYELELRDGPEDRSVATVRVRAKRPRGERAEETAYALPARAVHPSFQSAPASLRFASAVAGAAEVLRESPFARASQLATSRRIACDAADDRPDRQEFCDLLGLLVRSEERASR